MTPVLEKALNLPVSYTLDGKLVSLREFVKNKDKDASIILLSSLTPLQRAKITVERLRAKPEFQLGFLGAGFIGKERAIAEVEALTSIGQSLIEGERYVIDALIEELESGRFKGMID
jgi:hypothetical protein